MKLKVLYEDEDVVVMMAPHDDELEKLVVDTIREHGEPMSWSELRKAFSGIAGEDRLRKAIYTLLRKKRLLELPGNRYGLPEMPGVLEEATLLEAKRKRALWYWPRRRSKRKKVEAKIN